MALNRELCSAHVNVNRNACLPSQSPVTNPSRNHIHAITNNTHITTNTYKAFAHSSSVCDLDIYKVTIPIFSS